MALIRAMVVLMLLNVSATIAFAESNPEHLVTINTRTFDLGTNVAEMRRTPDFIPMTDIDWLEPILNADPVFGPATVFHLNMTHPNNGSAEHLWSFFGVLGSSSRFTFTDNVPERFQIPGMEVRSETADWKLGFRMVPNDPSADYSVTCSMSRTTQEVSLCVVIASYPPDPLIFLKTRDYGGGWSWEERYQRFDEIAVRMREIVACLDVTDRELERDASGLPKLSGCKAGPGM